MSVAGDSDVARSAAPLAGVRAVVFDLDGTLVDSMPLVLRAFAHALAPFRPEMTLNDIFQRLGGPPVRMMLELIGDESKAAEAMRRLESFGFEDGSQVQPFTGMQELLVALRSRGLLLAIWTGRDRGTTQAILSAHGLGSFFTVMVCGDDLPTHKPHPAGLIEILRKLDLRSGEVLYVGDADADVLGGAGAGVPTILIRHDRREDEAITAKAWRSVGLPADAYALIRTTLLEK